MRLIFLTTWIVVYYSDSSCEEAAHAFICWLATPTSQAWRQATIIDELFESLFESRGKEVGSPHLKEYKTMKAQEYKKRIRVGLGTDASKAVSLCTWLGRSQAMPHKVHWAWSLAKHRKRSMKAWNPDSEHELHVPHPDFICVGIFAEYTTQE